MSLLNRGKPDSLRLTPGDSPGTGSSCDRGIGIIAFTALVALLHLGRDVFIPLTVALMLSLLIAPLVRALRRIGIGQTSSVLLAILTGALAVMGIAGVLATQVLHVAANLPQYERTLQHKVSDIDRVTLGRLASLTSEEPMSSSEAAGPSPPSSGNAPVSVELYQSRASPIQLMGRALASLWAPLESTGIALIVLVFVLLEREGLRDRFIRVAGGANIRHTTLALNDAGERLSKYFVSQFAVNLGVGVAVGLGLAALGVPQAALWGVLTTLLRFVPYIGVWLAALPPFGLAIALAPGWSLAASTLFLFLAVELIAGQAVEPHLYGHATGLSPLSVVVAAIFWSALWGPVGLVLSTPLTLCLVVIGRYTRALNFLDLLLGNTQALTLPQKLYQRALSGDAVEVLALARAFLKRESFAAYCDVVVLPALHLAFLDREAGAISEEQMRRMRNVLVEVVSALGGEPRRLRRRPPSVLDDRNAGLILRQHREQLVGKWQGALGVPPGSILLCLGLGSRADTIAAELLARALREQRLDARHVSTEDLEAGSKLPTADPATIAIAYLVSAFPSAEREHADETAGQIRQRLPHVRVVAVFLPGITLERNAALQLNNTTEAASSFVDAVQMSLERKRSAAP